MTRGTKLIGTAFVPVLALAAVLAVAGSLPASLVVDNRIDPITWAMAACAATLVACCVLLTAVPSTVGHGAGRDGTVVGNAAGQAADEVTNDGPPAGTARETGHGTGDGMGSGTGRRMGGWSRVVTAVWVAGVTPYAVESVPHHRLADLSLAAMAIAVSLSLGRRRAWSVVAMALATGVACACEATATIWVVACVTAAIRRKERRAGACLVLACGVLGVITARFAGWPQTAGQAIYSVVYAMHRDLMIVIPAVLLGLVGYAKAHADTADYPSEQSFLRAWTPIAACALLLLLLGVPLDVRLCVLPLLWWTPTALTELGRITTGCQTPPSPVRAIGVLSCFVTATLAITGLRHLANGPLFALHLFAP